MEAFWVEFELQGLSYQRLVTVPVVYKSGEEEAIIVEVKSRKRYELVFEP